MILFPSTRHNNRAVSPPHSGSVSATRLKGKEDLSDIKMLSEQWLILRSRTRPGFPNNKGIYP